MVRGDRDREGDDTCHVCGRDARQCAECGRSVTDCEAQRQWALERGEVSDCSHDAPIHPPLLVEIAGDPHGTTSEYVPCCPACLPRVPGREMPVARVASVNDERMNDERMF